MSTHEMWTFYLPWTMAVYSSGVFIGMYVQKKKLVKAGWTPPEPPPDGPVDDEMDLAFLRAMKGSSFSPTSTIVLPSGREITGDDFDNPLINPYFDI